MIERKEKVIVCIMMVAMFMNMCIFINDDLFVHAEENTYIDSATPSDAPKKLVDADIKDQNFVVSEYFNKYIIDIDMDLTYVDLSTKKLHEHIELTKSQHEWEKKDSYGNIIYFLVDIGYRDSNFDKTAYIYVQYSTFDEPVGRWDAFCEMIVDVKYDTPNTETIIKKPTCTVAGLKKVWNRRTMEYEIVDAPATGHSYGSKAWVIKPASTEKSGNRQYCRVCKRCNGRLVYKSASILQAKKMYLEYKSYTYTGKPIIPSFSVLDVCGGIIAASNYTVTCTNNVEVGIATIKVTFTGKYYKGTLYSKYVIQPPVPKMSFSNTIKGTRISWTKSRGADGYIIYGSRPTRDGWTMKKIADIENGNVCTWIDEFSRNYSGQSIDYAIEAYKKTSRHKWGEESEKTMWMYEDGNPRYEVERATKNGFIMKIYPNRICTGYEIRYSSDYNMRKYYSKNVNRGQLTSGYVKILRKLSDKRKYYVKIRGYAYVDGKKYYTSWGKKYSFEI